MNLKELAEALKIDLNSPKYNFIFEQYKNNIGINPAHKRTLEIMIFDRISELVEKIEDKGE
jgi:hypothetical protein